MPYTLTIARLPHDEPVPRWGMQGGFFSITATPHEVSVVCEEQYVPAGVRCETEWRAIQVEGPIDFSVIGVLSSLSATIAAAGISLFSISTFDTDYLLVRDSELSTATDALRSTGHEVA